MNINWKVRLKNPVFWAQIAVAILLPILACVGLSWEDMTTWGAIGQVLLDAVKNPVVIVSVLVSVFNTLTDPTTKGLSDSKQALTYTQPKAD